MCRACSPAPAQRNGNGESESQSQSQSQSGIPWDGGPVWVGRTRRKPVPGGSMAPSMAPTVLPTHTAPPLTDPRGCWWVPTVGRHICQISKFIYRNSSGIRARCAATGSDPVLRQIAEVCRRRGGSGGGGVRGLDAAAQPPWTGLRRLPPPDPPRLPTGNQLLPLLRLWPLQVQGCKPCNPKPLSTACAPAHPPAAGCTGTARSRSGSCRHCAGTGGCRSARYCPPAAPGRTSRGSR